MLQDYIYDPNNPWVPLKRSPRQNAPKAKSSANPAAGILSDALAQQQQAQQAQDPEQQAQAQPQSGGISGFLGSPQLLAIAAGLLSSSGPSYKPIGLGEAFGAGLNNMFKVNGQLSEQQAKQTQLQMQREEMQARKEMMKDEMGLKREEMGMKGNQFGMEYGLQKAGFDLDVLKSQQAMNNTAQLYNMITNMGAPGAAAAGPGSFSGTDYTSLMNVPAYPSSYAPPSTAGSLRQPSSVPPASDGSLPLLVNNTASAPSYMSAQANNNITDNGDDEDTSPIVSTPPAQQRMQAGARSAAPPATQQIQLDPMTRQLAGAYVLAGHPDKAIDLIQNSAGGSYGDIKIGVGGDGKPAYFQIDKAGHTRAVSDFAPPPKESDGYGDIKTGVGPDGKPVFFQIDKAGNVKTTQGVTPPQKASDASPIQQEMAKIDAKSVGDSREALRQAISMRSSLDAFGEAQQQVPSWEQGRIAGHVSPYFSTSAQAAQTYGNQVSLLAKTLLGMPSNNFSDADRQFLIDASVGLTKNAEANRQVVSKLKLLLNQSVRYNQTLEKQLNETGNLSGAAANFYNQEYNSGGNDAPAVAPLPIRPIPNGSKVRKYNPATGRIE